VRVTGFWESEGPNTPPEVRTTIGPVAIDDLLERLRGRLETLEPGSRVRVDLIVGWNDE
jgi:hypothetical protein